MAANNNPSGRYKKKRALQRLLQRARYGDAHAQQELMEMSKYKSAAERIAKGIKKLKRSGKKRPLLGAAKPPIYTAGGMLVTSIVSGGGGPGTGKRR